MSAENDGGYQVRFHVAAKRISDATGPSIVRRLWDAWCLDDARLERVLAEQVDPSATAVITGWA